MTEESSLTESENSAERDFEKSSKEEKNKNFYHNRKKKCPHFSKLKKKVNVKSSSTAGKTFTYIGKTRKKKTGFSLSVDSL
jgi:hypothetical protein